MYNIFTREKIRRNRLMQPLYVGCFVAYSAIGPLRGHTNCPKTHKTPLKICIKSQLAMTE